MPLLVKWAVDMNHILKTGSWSGYGLLQKNNRLTIQDPFPVNTEGPLILFVLVVYVGPFFQTNSLKDYLRNDLVGVHDRFRTKMFSDIIYFFPKNDMIFPWPFDCGFFLEAAAAPAAVFDFLIIGSSSEKLSHSGSSFVTR
jgi:hypothetical protein